MHIRIEEFSQLRDRTPSGDREDPNGECFYDSPPPNCRLHEPENEEYSPLQAAKLKTKMRDGLVFTITST